MAVLRFCALVLSFAFSAAAQESPVPTSTPPAVVPARSVRINFLPPPLEGTISLGIYDARGALVRVLQREADLDDFDAGNDSLTTIWDGKNDAGADLPAGKYHARGYLVGEELDAEGVGYLFNDWITDEASLRIAHVSAVAIETGVPLISVKLKSGKGMSVVCDNKGNIVTTGEDHARSDSCNEQKLPRDLADPISCASGKDDTLWLIDRLAKGSAETEVEQYSAEHELLRRLSIPHEDPQPRQIAASKDTDTIYLLEDNSGAERIRALTLLETKNEAGQPVSDWKIDFEKKIVAHKDFGIENGTAVPGGKAPPEKIAIKLTPNPLQKNEPGSVEIAVGYDANGSFLKTADGLPLLGISETRDLTRIVFSAHGEKSLNVFQDDDVVVEQFRIDNIDRMMAFDCGEIELK